MLKYLFSLGLLIIVFVDFAQAPSNDTTERWDGSYGSLGTKCPETVLIPGKLIINRGRQTKRLS